MPFNDSLPKETIELEPLGFLEKSHCAPILIALNNNGMMNRNQVYKTLGDPIRLIIKRIDLLKQYGLIYEIKMIVKPFAKYINLTKRGKVVALYLANIQKEMEVEYLHPISLFEFHFSPKAIKNHKPIFESLPIPITDTSVISVQKKLTTCPNCSNTLHAIKEGRRAEWKCFYCGFRKFASQEELTCLWEIELMLNMLKTTDINEK